ncbi:Predicted transcriptional regulator [Yersinia mollaretii ATCC 43969]|uniref:Predicted transcriptional regulator n=2 Tax=Yersinia mollaretii TaxID=33060 RepID=A0ABM9Y677_YERMW|nr:Predicted transcriptional regulator [Yersinia mollaretii ATCC 43969]
MCFNVYCESHQENCVMVQNNIKQLRIQLSITQRELAAAVGTSQQQIQRIETGKVAARLEVAQAICSVLKKPLNVVFPNGDHMLRRLSDKRSSCDDDLGEMAKNGIEMDGCAWSVKLWLRGHQDYLLLPISPADQRRFYAYFQEKASPDIEHFFVFDSDEHRYALNSREVAFHQFLFEPLGRVFVGENHKEDDGFTVHIILENGGPAIELCCESDELEDEEFGDIGQLNGFFDMLESDPETTERYMITDMDGEDAFIRIGSIAMVRIALNVLEPVEDDDQ